MSAAVYVFAGGGTGGHLYPGLAVAEQLLKLRPGAQIVFACSNRPIDRRILDPLPYAVVAQPVRPLPRRPLDVPGFLRAWFASAVQAREMVGDLRPRAVLGLGGFAAGPVVRHAARAGVPAALLNPDAVPGRANRWLARFADVIFTQFAATAESFPSRLRGKVRHVGCPIRNGFGSVKRDEAMRYFGLQDGRKVLLAFGGSLLAEPISEALGMLCDDLRAFADSWQVLHVATAPLAARIEEKLKTCGILTRTLAYCDRMDLAYAAADLALCRSGAGTVAELAAAGTPAVLMPYPHHKDRQQLLNAARLVEAGAAKLCEDAKDPSANAARLREVLVPILQDADVPAKMRESAAGLARPNAASEVADWLVKK